MGDRYELDLKCIYCGKENKEVWYAPTCNSDTFNCEFCKKKNFITSELKSKKSEEVTEEDVREGFEMCSNVHHPEERIKRICEEKIKNLKVKNETN